MNICVCVCVCVLVLVTSSLLSNLADLNNVVVLIVSTFSQMYYSYSLLRIFPSAPPHPQVSQLFRQGLSISLFFYFTFSDFFLCDTLKGQNPRDDQFSFSY